MFLDLIRDSLFMNIEMTHFPLYLSSFHSWGVGGWGLTPPPGGAVSGSLCGQPRKIRRGVTDLHPFCACRAQTQADGYRGEGREAVLTWDRRPDSCGKGHR